ncbi:uncharacterized protein LOC123202865 [Mangifera indica]|uniref:uncharacterized protein LOC123202846 n=1 Tax=Mangifera indica TaxID=29780 RepID=UPI001CFB65AE|nr:uncharacterized protein LOC123202846 [Mangifera indica]XP_044474951.1 uncharacterized protein LOC123202865 [Mangifera indica]
MLAPKVSMTFHQNSPPLMIITQVVSISFLLLLHSPSPALALPTSSTHNPSSLVDSVCKEANEEGHLNYNDCVAALMLDPKALSARNKKLLAKIELNLALSNSTSSLTYIDAMAKKEKSSPALKSALEYCVSQYKDTVQCFKMALMDLDVDPEAANYDAFVANDGQYYCGEQLNSKGFQSQVVDSINTRNYYVMLYSRIGQIITNKMT